MSPEIRGLWPNIVLFVATQQDKRLDLQGPIGYVCKCASLKWTHQKKGNVGNMIIIVLCSVA